MTRNNIPTHIYVAASTPFLWLKTDEYVEAVGDTQREIKSALPQERILRWDIIGGIKEIAEGENKASIDRAEGQPNTPMTPLDFIKKLCDPGKDKREKQSSKNTVMFLMDYHCFIKQPNIWRYMLELIPIMTKSIVSVIIVSPMVDIPEEISNYITVIDYSLPDKKFLIGAVNNLAEAYGCQLGAPVEEIANAGLGMSRNEFMQAIYLNIADGSCNGLITAEYVMNQKEARLKKESVIKTLKSSGGFETIIGLDRLKKFTSGMVKSGKGRGVLLLGVPGSGKSAFAAALGEETGRTALSLDFATLQGSLVGQTEGKTDRALKLADAMQPCVLVIDEIEKGLAGTSGYSGDSGTSRRQGSLFLKWLNDHTTDVYVVATANNISDLPPEYLRAERWDAIFFVDIPGEKQASGILDYYKKAYGIPEEQKTEVTELTGAEIKSVCRIASCMEITLEESKGYVVPIMKSMTEKITDLREYARKFANMADSEQDEMYKTSESESTAFDAFSTGMRTINRQP